MKAHLHTCTSKPTTRTIFYVLCTRSRRRVIDLWSLVLTQWLFFYLLICFWPAFSRVLSSSGLILLLLFTNIEYTNSSKLYCEELLQNYSRYSAKRPSYGHRKEGICHFRPTKTEKSFLGLNFFFKD